MGQVADYFKPDAGYSYCDMLVSSNKHLWSADGEVWEKPEYTPHGRHFGGSRWSWPRKTQARHGDSRLYLSHWGGPNGWLWGCCYDSYDGKPSWRRMFSLSYCGIGLKPPLECTKFPTNGGSAKQRCERGNDLKDGYEYVYNEGRYRSWSACNTNSCWCCRREKESKS